MQVIWETLDAKAELKEAGAINGAKTTDPGSMPEGRGRPGVNLSQLQIFLAKVNQICDFQVNSH
jgi:hypothetical protein